MTEHNDRKQRDEVVYVDAQPVHYVEAARNKQTTTPEIAALRQRIEDIAAAALSLLWSEVADDIGPAVMAFGAGEEHDWRDAWKCFVGGVVRVFNLDRDVVDTAMRDLETYQAAAEWLHEQGVRA